MATHFARVRSEAHATANGQCLSTMILDMPHGFIGVQIACTKRWGNVEGFSGGSVVWPNLIRAWQPILAPVKSMSLMNHDTKIIGSTFDRVRSSQSRDEAFVC